MAEEEPVSLTLDNNNNNNLHKRKLQDLEQLPSDVAPVDSSDPDNKDAAAEDLSKRPRFDEAPDSLAGENGLKAEEDNGHTELNAEAEAEADVGDTRIALEDQAGGDESVKEGVGNDTQKLLECEQEAPESNSEGKAVEDIVEKAVGDVPQEPVPEDVAEGDADSVQQNSESGSRSTTRRIEIPNNKVGVLIGKSGDTIKYLQINSGAKIQITRDADADPSSASRSVELVGAPESLNKAERLIKDVIAEADAGGSPSLVARGFTAAITSGSIEIEIPVPSDKVGILIGRGGDTIRNLQTRSGARIQLIPQNVPGEQSKEKKVKVTGDKKQVEMARELIKEVMNQPPGRPSQFSGNNYNQQGYRPRAPGGAPQWGNRGPPPQSMPYDYHQRGPYPSQSQQYPPQSYGNYPYQGPPRSNFGSGWELRPAAQGPQHSAGYDYYGQSGGHAATPHSTHGHPSGPSMAHPQSQANYNYGQPRGADYAHPTPYSQTAPPAQNYGPGYGEPKYDGQAPLQQSYGGQGYAPQQQGYAPQQQGYAPQQQGYAPQQQYNRPPAYGAPAQGAPPQAYAAPTASQPTDTNYQAPMSAAQPYGQNVQPHQQYPYAPGATTQPPYGSAPVSNESYTQPQPQPAAAYAQQGAQPVPAYGQQPASYAQTAASNAGYGQYPASAQPGYGDQSAAAAAAASSAASYGYQGQVDPSAYAAGQSYSAASAPVIQQGFAQPVAAPVYDQSASQAGGYASAPGAPTPAPAAAAAAAAAAYGKTVSPQPGYAQYDASQQMYAAPR